MPTSPINSSSPPSISVSHQQNNARQDKVRSRKDYFPETVNNLGQIFRDIPDLSKGTLKGIASVTGQYQDISQDNYLFSLDAKDSIIITLYSASLQKGVVYHFDENKTVEDEVRKAIDFLGGAQHPEKIEAHLIGGVWFGSGEQLGHCIRETLRSYQIEPAWQDWSFIPCYGHRYGAVLELRHGDLLVFEHTIEMGVNFWRNKWKAAQIRSQVSVEQTHRPRQLRNLARINSDCGSVESINSVGSRGSTGSATSFDSSSIFNGNAPKTISLENSVGAVKYRLIGEDKCVKHFRNAFNARVDNKRCEYAKKTRPEIMAFLEGVKQALPGEEKIELRMVKPSRRAQSRPSASKNESYSLTDTNAAGSAATTAPRPFFTKAYVRQEKSFSAAQKEMIHKELEEIVNGGMVRFFKKAHTADKFRFSQTDQSKISDDYGKEITKLYSYPLPKWDGGDKGKGKWRLIYKQEGNRISFFGVYNTHKYIYTAYA